MKVQSFARLEEGLRHLLTSVLPPKISVSFYSKGRSFFAKKLADTKPIPYSPPSRLKTTLWGIEFGSPIFNAAGMFKAGDGYELVAGQGAGAFLAGTSTASPRDGNKKHGISLPFAPFPKSHAALNFLGLPNPGDEKVAQNVSWIEKKDGCPLGVSITASPDLEEEAAQESLIAGLIRYAESNVDFIEMNESCPNTEEDVAQDSGLRERLERVKLEFLDTHRVPVIVKFSNDTPTDKVPALMEMLIDFGFHGVNFGNSSTKYVELGEQIHKNEKKLYNYFHKEFGGGLTGLPLKSLSLELVKAAAEYLEKTAVTSEFHIIRTGGVFTAEDVKESLEAGASLVQWYTGYFEGFAAAGHGVYRNLYKEL